MNTGEDLVGFNRPRNAFEKDEQIDEVTYFDECTDYALKTGLVKKSERDSFRDKYLKPIHQKYIEALEEVLTEINEEPNADQLIKLVTKRLNAILGRTIRIGSTEPENITRSISEYMEWACNDTYTGYAAETLASKVLEVLAA